MEIYDVIKKRRSVRKYKNEVVPDDALQRVLDAARIAPSAGNRQPWHFIVIKEPKQKELLKRSYSVEWFYTAPVIIVGCVDSSKAWIRNDGVNYGWVDLAIAIDHLILAAFAEGLGTCWIGAFDEKRVKEALNIPDTIEVVTMTPLGYPAEDNKPTPRKSINEILHLEKW